MSPPPPAASVATMMRPAPPPSDSRTNRDLLSVMDGASAGYWLLLLISMGFVGLAGAFFYAGAGRVLVSLWDVGDKATAELMDVFYGRLLQGGEPPARALRSAQRHLLRREERSDPYYWAGFVLQGEWM